MKNSAYDFRDINKQETGSTDDDDDDDHDHDHDQHRSLPHRRFNSQATAKTTISIQEDGEVEVQQEGIGVSADFTDWDARVVAISSWRTRQSRRRKLYLAGFICIVILIITIVIVAVSGNSTTSSAPLNDEDNDGDANAPSQPEGDGSIEFVPAMPNAVLSPTFAPAMPNAVPSPTTIIPPITSPSPPTSIGTLPPVWNSDNNNIIPQSIVLASDSFLERDDYVSSPSGEYMAGLDQNGNLLLQNNLFESIWSAETDGGYRLYMQSDGNLIVRDESSNALWTSGTYSNDGAILIVDDHGRIAVVGTDDTPLWIDGIPRGTYTGPSSEDLAFPTRGIFYYPWFPETWTVNGQPVKFPPDIGLYSSSDPSVAANHIDAMDYADIDLSIASWWGPETNLDRARLTLLMDMTAALQSPLKWTIYYEDEKWTSTTVEYIRNDLDYLKKWFAWHPGWAHVDGRPIIFVFNGGGCDIINRWMDASNGEWYVVIKIFQRYWECPRQPDHWHQYGTHDGDPLQYDDYSVTLAPGFWKADEPNPRAPRIGKDEWCEDVRQMASSTAEAWHLIVSFNEAGEGTNIEASPHWSTDTGYGYYLDCLHEYPTVRI